MFITSSSIDKVRELQDVRKIFEHYIGEGLKKKGNGYVCKSPFTDEKTGSCVVTPGKSIWKCFSSGNGGDAIRFVMLHDRCDFVDAIKQVASIQNIQLTYEKMEPEQEKRHNASRAAKLMLSDASRIYTQAFHKLNKDHWAYSDIHTNREFSDETITTFAIGYAPDDFKTLTTPFINQGCFSLAKELGLCNTKNSTNFDCFKDRIIFPIHNPKGEIVGFGGRCSDAAKEGGSPKFINSKDSDTYHKDRLLYGFYQGSQQLGKTQTAYLTEGYTDVIAMHQSGYTNTVASCGTGFSEIQAKLLSRLVKHVVLMRDGDEAGIKAADRDLDILLKAHFKVSIVVMPEKEDPQSLTKKLGKEFDTFLEENTTDALEWKAARLKADATDPDSLSEAIQNIGASISCIYDDFKRDAYIKSIAKFFGIKRPMLEKHISNTKAEASKNDVKVQRKELPNGFPEGGDPEQYYKDRFVEARSCCYFEHNHVIFRGTNFVLKPLFHVYGKMDNVRICELINFNGEKRIVDFQSTDLINFGKIKERLANEGYFVWEPGASNQHFQLVANKIMSRSIMAYELRTLGYQKEGFFAYANGVLHEGSFREVDKFGIVELNGLDYEESEYLQKVKHYYSPACSEIYKASRYDDDPYENDRCFVYKKAPVSLEEWMAQFTKVYAEKAPIGIAFIIASLFRDFIMSRYGFFPLLFLTGEKGSGKSKFGDSLANFFTHKLNPFDLNSGTIVAFYRRLARGRNIPSFFEEYHDKVDDKVFQSLKGAFDGRGREKGKESNDNRTTVTKINCSLILASQYLSTRDDNSLPSRSLIEHFVKPSSYTQQAVVDYNKLKEYEEIGLSSLIGDIVKHRPYIENSFHTEFAAIARAMKNALGDTEYQERMLNNYVAMLTPIKMLKDRIKFPFEYDAYFDECKQRIIDTSDLIVESEGLSEFWQVLDFLSSNSTIRAQREFAVETVSSLRLMDGRKEIIEWTNEHHKRILLIRLNIVHQQYSDAVSKRENAEVIGQSTLRHYFKSKKYFIGQVKSYRFKNGGSSSCMAFDYDMMHSQNIINLRGFSESDVVHGAADETPAVGDTVVVTDEADPKLPF